MWLAVLALLASSSPESAPGKEIQWVESLERALELAQEQDKVVFVALNVDGEARAERLSRDTYFEKDVVALSKETVNVIGSPTEHRAKGACKMFQEVSCLDHQRADAEIRAELVAVNDLGLTPVPQHLWLDAQGEVLLSVPYEITAEELAWCFAFAAWKRDPSRPFTAEPNARAPRRAVFSGVYALPAGSRPGRGLTETELELALDEMRSSTWTDDRVATWVRVAFTDDEKAVSTIRTGLGSGALTWGGVERLNGAIDFIGEWSPRSYLPVLLDFIDHRNAEVRKRVAVALEQWGDPDAARALEKALAKEKDVAVQDNWIRALGACAEGSKSARKKLEKLALTSKEAKLRVNAILALGWTAHDEESMRFLRQRVLGEDEQESLAALCAVGFSRELAWLPELEGLMQNARLESVRKLAETVHRVLQGESLALLESDVRTLSGDELRRGRIFFQNP